MHGLNLNSVVPQCATGVHQGKLEYQLAFSTTGLIWSTVVNQLWRRFVPGFCHIIILLNVEFVQLRPIAVPLIPGTNGIDATMVTT